MYESGKIDDIPMDAAKTKSESNEESDDTESNTTGCRGCVLKTFDFFTRSPTLYRWNDIKFKINGFLIGMVIFDIVYEIASNGSIIAGLHALLRNVLLLILIFVCCIMRIKIFKSTKSASNEMIECASIDEEHSLERSISTDESGDDDENDGIQLKSVVFTYLGGLISLKSMTKVISKQCHYFSFSILFHAVFAFGFWIVSASIGGKETLKWLRTANFYCMVLCLLPVPGFDGAALSTIVLKEKFKWGKVAITSFLLIVSCIITVTCGIIAIFMRTVMAFYLTFYCGLRVLQYVFNPKDENMKVLKAMAKTTDAL